MAGSEPGNRRGSDRPTMSSPIGFRQESAPADGGAGAAPGVSAADVRPGGKVGKYQIVRLLGKGGMGSVYEAIDAVLHRKVALKILPHEFAQNQQALQRFVREARLAARLNHPNAVCVYDVGKKGTIYYIAMELVRGDSGQQVLEKSKSLDWREAAKWIADACRALIAAHGAGLIHRDIKPANMLRASDSGVVKLSDFGLAKPTDGGAQNLALTQKDVFIGTPLFMSPEQCRNDNVDPRSDIYSLGATFYTLLTGAAPYNQGSSLQILFAHCSAPIPDVRETLPDAPPLCAQIIQKSMAKDPKDRYQTAAEMLADLEALLGGETGGIDDPVTAAMQDLAATAAVPSQGPAMSQFGSTAAAMPSSAPWQSQAAPSGMSRREQQMWTRAIVAAAALLVVGIVIAVLLGRSSGSEDNEVATVATPQRTPAAPVAAAPAPSEEPAQVAPTEAPAPAAPVVPVAPISEAVEAPVVAEAPPTDPPAASAEPAPTASLPTASPPMPAPAEPVPAVEPEPVDPTVETEPEPNEMAVRQYRAARLWTAIAARKRNEAAVEKGAQALILWHDFFERSPHPEHEGLAEHAQRLAERYSPGISAKQPRVNPGAAGPPLPPQHPRDPDTAERPEPPQQQPKQRPTPPARRPDRRLPR